MSDIRYYLKVVSDLILESDLVSFDFNKDITTKTKQ